MGEHKEPRDSLRTQKRGEATEEKVQGMSENDGFLAGLESN